MTNVREQGLREVTNSEAESLLLAVDDVRKEASARLDPRRRAQMGQFLTPSPIATFMAGMFDCRKSEVRILDPGAGAGTLCAALVLTLCQRPTRPATISVTAYEVDPLLVGYLRETLDRCGTACEDVGVSFQGRLVDDDFLAAGANALAGDLFSTGEQERFDCAILNPPYRKIRTESRERSLLRSVGLETTNLYTGFVAVAARLLMPGGEMVAITPRSFCNGPYFEAFRRYFLRDMRFRRVHVFDARDSAFADDKVLQENVVFHAVKNTEAKPAVIVSASPAPGGADLRMRTIKHDELIRPRDRHAIIHVVPEKDGESIRDQLISLGGTVSDLGLTVSTGRVVDFRARDLLRSQPGKNTAPLIYPCHFKQGFVEWPNGKTRKPNALALGPRAEELVVPEGHYVLTKRFSTKEERRRIVAAVYDPARVNASQVAFENHVNYFHTRGGGLLAALAKGLAAYLNSSLVDTYFRQFSGHTRVNASDLRSLPYPTRSALIALGRRIGKCFPAQEELDRLVDEVLFRG
ncbi:MAG: Eco57I restriction-modification methylase domain-containing protein [Planctomycetes bacterium]|nr:Eco57I restriction-modification methylase domain-containing protein [Planctomycetota bacterium]